MERLTKYDTNGQAMIDCQKCKADWTGKHGKPMADCTALYCRNRLLDRLVKYEDTGLTPEQCAEYGKADREGRYIVLRDAERVKRLRELAEADKEGRVAVLPCEVGGSMLDMSDIEHPEIMKRLHFAVAYDSSRGVVFYQPYDIFRANFDAAYIQPLSKEAAAMLKEVQNG
nr:MAG TPA: hypothetical protein [Caudoviricetes sp.]DAH95070.1 MAG TPA: hypothetical protein [Caudoviricetes sp.]